MDVSFLIKQYFEPGQDVSIDVFDAESLYSVYRNVMRTLTIRNGLTGVTENGFWQGTILYMELNTSRDIDPQSVVDHRTDAEGEYNEGFIETDELTSLW